MFVKKCFFKNLTLCMRTYKASACCVDVGLRHDLRFPFYFADIMVSDRSKRDQCYRDRSRVARNALKKTKYI